MKTYYQKTKGELEQEFGYRNEGLTDEQVTKIRDEKGRNVLEEGKKKSTLEVFFDQFKDLLVVILLVAAVISMFSGNMESTLVIIIVLIVNAILGTVQHDKAAKSLESLKQLSSPHAKVLRNGQKIEIDSAMIVPGDIVLLEAGDLIVADGRIIQNYSLQVNESSLTGESANVEKDEAAIEREVPLAERKNMVYSGTLVTYGRAEVVVTATGMETEIGNIARLMNDTKERKTPLQISLDQFSRKLAFLIMIICAIVFALCIYRDMKIIDSLMFAVALAVAAIPEALGSIVTIVQAMGTQKMAREHAIMKELKAVESLGCVSVICSDKTGTLTQNKMTVQKLYVQQQVIEPQDIELSDPVQKYLVYNAVLNNDSSIVEGKGIGDPTEYALLEMARKISEERKSEQRTESAGQEIESQETQMQKVESQETQMQKAESSETQMREEYRFQEGHLREQYPRIEELAFDSERKLMSSSYQIDGKRVVLTKGAVDVLLDRCAFADIDITKSNSENVGNDEAANAAMSAQTAYRNEIIRQNEEFSKQGLRVLAYAYKETTEPLTFETETGFTFLGLTAMVDPPREESKAAVAQAKEAGIRTVMITGDHKVTAAAIAQQIGIFEEGDLAVTGQELDAMSDAELDEKLEHITVYARVSPENKIRIVDAWQKKGKIVSMTGDGVNDAPALKKADIGVAMGITGTEVAKDAASMILSDDNFATIIKAVANGRNIYRNIKNAIFFLLSGNMAGILTVLYTSVIGLPVPFLPVHLLFMNLLTDSLPAIAIGMEAADDGVLHEAPRDPSTGIMTKQFMGRLFAQGGLIAIVTIIAFYSGYQYSAAAATTMAFATLTMSRLFHGFNCRSKLSVLKVGILSNRSSVGAFLTGVGLLLAVLFIPFLQRAFSIEPLSGMMFFEIILLAVIPTVIIQTART